jgi:hypothetical protein
LSLQREEEDVTHEITGSGEQPQSALEEHRGRRIARELAEENVRNQQARYDVGLANQDLIDFQDRLTQAEREEILSLTAYNSQWAPPAPCRRHDPRCARYCARAGPIPSRRRGGARFWHAPAIRSDGGAHESTNRAVKASGGDPLVLGGAATGRAGSVVSQPRRARLPAGMRCCAPTAI